MWNSILGRGKLPHEVFLGPKLMAPEGLLGIKPDGARRPFWGKNRRSQEAFLGPKQMAPGGLFGVQNPQWGPGWAPNPVCGAREGPKTTFWGPGGPQKLHLGAVSHHGVLREGQEHE